MPQPPACPVATFYDYSTTCFSSHNVATTPSFCHRLESRFIKVQNKTGRNSENSARSFHFLLVYLSRLEIEGPRQLHPSTITLKENTARATSLSYLPLSVLSTPLYAAARNWNEEIWTRVLIGQRRNGTNTVQHCERCEQDRPSEQP